MSNIYLSSDLHLNHKKILSFGRTFNSIEDHDEYIIEKHNSVVKSDDVCYILGDVLLDNDNCNIVRRLNGKKRLILGNHDTYNRLKNYYMDIFEKVCSYDTLGYKDNYKSQMILSHIPIHPSQLEERYRMNVHGHLHKHTVKDHTGEPDLRYLCVSMEQINFTPISYEEVKQKFKERGLL